MINILPPLAVPRLWGDNVFYQVSNGADKYNPLCFRTIDSEYIVPLGNEQSQFLVRFGVVWFRERNGFYSTPSSDVKLSLLDLSDYDLFLLSENKILLQEKCTEKDNQFFVVSTADHFKVNIALPKRTIVVDINKDNCTIFSYRTGILSRISLSGDVLEVSVFEVDDCHIWSGIIVVYKECKLYLTENITRLTESKYALELDSKIKNFKAISKNRAVVQTSSGTSLVIERDECGVKVLAELNSCSKIMDLSESHVLVLEDNKLFLKELSSLVAVYEIDLSVKDEIKVEFAFIVKDKLFLKFKWWTPSKEFGVSYSALIAMNSYQNDNLMRHEVERETWNVENIKTKEGEFICISVRNGIITNAIIRHIPVAVVNEAFKQGTLQITHHPKAHKKKINKKFNGKILLDLTNVRFSEEEIDVVHIAIDIAKEQLKLTTV